MQQIKEIVESGVNLIVTGGKIGDLAQHYCNKYKIMVVRLTSKWDIRRLCKSIGATPLPKIVSTDNFLVVIVFGLFIIVRLHIFLKVYMLITAFICII